MATDVIIVGAGPVGLMLANQLQRRGIRYRLLESRAGREYGCKALGFSPRSLEIFDHMGILAEALAHGLFFTAVNTVVGGETAARVEISPDKYPYGPMVMGQFDTEEILERELVRRGGAVEWSSQVSAIQRTMSGVEVEWSHACGPQKELCRYLVGCDGARSLVRKSLGLAFEGEKVEQHFFLGDVELEWNGSHSEVHKLVQLNSEGQVCNVVAVVPIPGNQHRFRLSTALPPELVENPLEPLEMLRQVCLPLLPEGSEIKNLNWASHYSISHRIANKYREGNCFLAGDAAHIHPPIGGLARNTGLQDAFNLGWKLAAVVRGEALDSLLDSYHDERHKVGREVVELTAGPDAAEEEANTQFLINYRESKLAQGRVPEGDRGAAPGERLDTVQGLRCPYLSVDLRLIEFQRHGDFLLVGYGGDWGSLAGLVAELQTALGSAIYAVAIVDPAGPRPSEPLLCVHDAGGQARQAWGDGPGAILVRPDGYVGWRGRPTRDGELDRFLAQVSIGLIP